jgi:NodT family efflux transporter outer membrane factor (OMF) lipoprotein
MASLQQSLENVAAGEGAYSPSVSGNISSVNQYFNGAAFGAPSLSSIFLLNTASVSVSYPLDVFGGLRRQVESLKALADYQRFQLDAAYLTLTSNIVLTAILEASLREQIRATRTIVSLEEKNLESVRRQFAIGFASRSAVLAQKTALAQEKATLPGLEKQLALEHHQMSVYLGRFPGEKIGENFRIETLTLPKDLPLTLPSRLIEQRPDVRSAEAQLHSASALVGVATANMLPQISISGQYGSETLSSFLGPNSAFWSYGPSLAQPLFQGGTLLHRKRAAVAAFQLAKAQYRNTVLQAFQNVADTLRALRSDADTLEAQMEVEQDARESLRIAKRQFDYGAIGYPNLSIAQQNYQQALISLVQARANRYSDTVALFQSLGGGWWNLGKKEAPGQMKDQQKKS